MNILSYSHAYPGSGHNGGAETTLHDIMRLLRLDKHTTTALLSKPHPDGSGSYVLDGVKVQAFSSKKDPEYMIHALDLMISHLECAARTGMLSRAAGKKSIQLLHNDQDYCYTSAEKYSDGLIYNTNWIVSKYKGIKAARQFAVLHPPVDPARYAVETTREYITIVNLTIGTSHRLAYDKGGLTFYELAARFPDEKFLGVKGGYGDQYVPEELPPNVTILEHTNNILDVYRRSKVILTPSSYESYGRVAVEAACSGIPAIMTETEGTREAMGYSANFCEFGNYDQWEDTLGYVLKSYDHASKCALERAESNWKRTKQEWDAVRGLIYRLGGVS